MLSLWNWRISHTYSTSPPGLDSRRALSDLVPGTVGLDSVVLQPSLHHTYCLPRSTSALRISLLHSRRSLIYLQASEGPSRVMTLALSLRQSSRMIHLVLIKQGWKRYRQTVVRRKTVSHRRDRWRFSKPF